ncbi:MAG: hypothetical protein AAF826_12525 [Pseudomonadota bacterium]
MLLRMQDANGRGPWKPGFSDKWVDNNRRFDLPALQEDFGVDFAPMVDAAFNRGLHLGTAVKGQEKFNMWFTPSERVKLAMFGYRIVDASSCEVLGETNWQVIIGSPNPLSELPLAPSVAA